jgi:hypothetical protein
MQEGKLPIEGVSRNRALIPAGIRVHYRINSVTKFRGVSMIVSRIPLLLAGLVLFAACSSVSVKEDYNPSTDFTKYKSYKFYDGETPQGDQLAANPLVKERLMRAVDEQMVQKGFKKVEGGAADLIVVMVAGVQQKAQVTQTGGYGWYGHGGYTDIDYYKEGTLVIDMVDASAKSLVWRGTGTGTLSENATVEDAEYNARQNVTKMLQNFPPTKK